MPWMDVKADGTIDVVWYDRRNDVNDVLWDVYIARSTDGGSSFSTNVRLNDTSFAVPSLSSGWMGEYLGLAVDSNTAYVAFTSSVTDSVSGDVYFDKILNSSIFVRGDFEPDGDVELFDLSVFNAAWRSTPSDVNRWNPACDIANPKDNFIGFKDLKVFVNNFLYNK